MRTCKTISKEICLNLSCDLASAWCPQPLLFPVPVRGGRGGGMGGGGGGGGREETGRRKIKQLCIKPLLRVNTVQSINKITFSKS